MHMKHWQWVCINFKTFEHRQLIRLLSYCCAAMMNLLKI